jgi:stringent starvation protein B
VLGDQVAGREVPEEPDFSVVPNSSAENVGHLGHYEDGHEQRARMGLEQFEAVTMVGVVCVYVRVQGAGVDQDRYRATSSRRISSIRTETS